MTMVVVMVSTSYGALAEAIAVGCGSSAWMTPCDTADHTFADRAERNLDVVRATPYSPIWSSEPGCLAGPGMSRYQNSGSQSAAGARRARRSRPGRRTGLERRLDGGGDALRRLRVDDDVPAEQHAADDLPGPRGRVVRAGGGFGHTRDCRRNGPGPVAGHAGFATSFTAITGRRLPGPGLRR